MSLADACARRPFANGTERMAWEHVWCNHCAHDHALHGDSFGPGPGCQLNSLIDLDEWPALWPEAWLPEPDDRFCLPSLMTCAQFMPCHEDACTGDPNPELRARVVAEVVAYWGENHITKEQR